MYRYSATVRIAMGLTGLGVSVLLISRSIGLGHDEWSATVRGRVALSESLAVHCATSLARGASVNDTGADLQGMVNRVPDLLSAAIYDHQRLRWATARYDPSLFHEEASVPGTKLVVPLMLSGKAWGELELIFVPVGGNTWRAWANDKWTRQVAFTASLLTLLYIWYLRRMLKHLDPSRVVPERVRSALDTLAEGLLVLDNKGRIVLANRAFVDNVGQSSDDLQGMTVDSLPWSNNFSESQRPWHRTIDDGAARLGEIVDLQVSANSKRTYMVNASPIIAEDGSRQGVLASFDDVTLHEQRKAELERALQVLADSREKIRQQNDELRTLATLDPLTGCLNRRSFFEKVEIEWRTANRMSRAMTFIMLDVDHFKSINDNFGHSMGDEVLKFVGSTLRNTLATNEMMCRYGGEEFCVLISSSRRDDAVRRAESFREAVESSRPGGINVTASVGVSFVPAPATGFQEVLDQADKCLYVAKRRGRNQVAVWDECVEEITNLEESKLADAPSHASPDARRAEAEDQIPFHAVSALISALSYRDARTAEHSRRVADRCVALANGMLSVRELYVLETAALLHDIGKIGVPDSILLKPGPLTEQEWRIMDLHDRIGVDIIATTFACPEMVDIVRCHHAWFGGNASHPELPAGEEIPIGGRILAICDAYDAITNDRVYRKAQSTEAAIAELRRCAGRQFDPVLVERFAELVTLNHAAREEHTSVSKQTALTIGVQMERLTQAFDSQDLPSVGEQAARIRSVAMDSGLSAIVAAATELELAATANTDVSGLIEITASLLDLCRSTQRAYLDVGQEDRRGHGLAERAPNRTIGR